MPRTEHLLPEGHDSNKDWTSHPAFNNENLGKIYKTIASQALNKEGRSVISEKRN